MDKQSNSLTDSKTVASRLESYCPQELRHHVETLTPVLYEDLRRTARRERGRMFQTATIQTTALIHEAYLRLSQSAGGYESQTHFLRVAAVTMRHLLINRVEMQRAAKRGGGAAHVELDDESAQSLADFQVQDEDTVLDVHEALLRLARFAPRLAQVVECRFFAGYSEAEIAEALGITERTVRRDWIAARAWLARELGERIATQALPAGSA